MTQVTFVTCPWPVRSTTVRPGDVVVITVPDETTQEVITTVVSQLQGAFGEMEVSIVLVRESVDVRTLDMANLGWERPKPAS